MTGPELKGELIALGVTDAEFKRVSGLSIPTLTKIFGNNYVRETSRNRAFTAFKALKKRLEAGLPMSDSQKAAG